MIDGVIAIAVLTPLSRKASTDFKAFSKFARPLIRAFVSSENPSMLICGYSFGDLYVNQLLQRHKLIHDKNERVLLVDKWDDVHDTESLFKQIRAKANSGLREYVLRIIECAYEIMTDTFKQFNKVADGCWESPNGILRIYTKGFKSAVVEHKEEVMSFLQESN